MKVAIIKSGNRVNVGGVSRTVDLSTLSATIRAVHWDGTIGHVEYNDGTEEEILDDFDDYQVYLDAWVAAEPPPPTLSELKAIKRQEFKTEAVTRMAAQVSAWNSFERIEFLLSIVNMLDTAAMTTEQTLAKDILLYAKNTAIPKVNATADQATLDTIDPTAADPFGDGTPWPV